jgi:hypothetical protein
VAVRARTRVVAAPAIPHYVRLDAPGQAPLARRRLATALASAGIGLSHCADGAGVQAITSAAPGGLVRRALAALSWPGVAVALRDDWTGIEEARTAGGRQA